MGTFLSVSETINGKTPEIGVNMRAAAGLVGRDQLTVAAPERPPSPPKVAVVTAVVQDTYVFTLRDGLFSLTRRTPGKRGSAVLCKTSLKCSAGCGRDLAQERRTVDHPRLQQLFGVRVPCCLGCEESLRCLALGDTATEREQCAVCLSTDACTVLRRDDTAAELHVCELCAKADWVLAIEGTGAKLRDTPEVDHPSNGVHTPSPKPRKRQRPEKAAPRKRKMNVESCGHDSTNTVSCVECAAQICETCLRQREPGMAPLYLSIGGWLCSEHSKS